MRHHHHDGRAARTRRGVAGLLAALTLAACWRGQGGITRTAPSIASEVLAAERQWSARGATQALPEAIGAMLVDDARMPAPRGEVLASRAAIVAALRATPDSTARAHWVPIQVGVAADGAHAFTVGFLVSTRADGSRAQFKVLTYWMRTATGWRAAAWRRRPMDLVAIDSAPLPPLLPPRVIVPTTDATTRGRHVAELRAAEAEFSALANQIGVGAAFAQRGTSVSLNVGPSGDGRFVRGADAIARAVTGAQALDAPSTITWSADTAIVATSNDLGITFGVIRPKNDPRATGTSFFTIWRKTDGVWRYVAE